MSMSCCGEGVRVWREEEREGRGEGGGEGG